jgi:protein-disulfide isomerase
MATLRVPITPHDHSLGPPNAPVTLVEYGDYECLHCGRAHQIAKLIQKRLGSGLRFVFRHFPLNQVHPNAEAAAQSAEYAGARGLLWEMHDGIYQNQDRLGLPLLFALARNSWSVGIGSEGGALVNGTFGPKVRADFLGGVRSGVNGTPTILRQWSAARRFL